MERIELRTEARTIQGKKVKRLRAENVIPAILYGPDTPALSIQVEERALFKTLQQTGTTSLIDLYVDKSSKPNVVLARGIQRDSLTGRLLHVDFYQVRLTETVKTMPRLEIVGESPLAKGGGAVMIQNMNEVEVECLPTDLINSIPVDVSGLETLESNVLIRDLPVPEGITILADPEDVVVSMVPVRAALEEEVVEKEIVVGEEVEVEEEIEVED
jgi:large subunit ribosomal protein L25